MTTKELKNDQILNIIIGIIVIGWMMILTINSMGRLIDRRQSKTDTLYLPPTGNSTILEDYQTANEILRSEHPQAQTRLEQIMDSLNTAE
jgi:hypothetical protein